MTSCPSASGYVAGIRRSALARLTDATIDLSQSRQRAALRRAASAGHRDAGCSC